MMKRWVIAIVLLLASAFAAHRVYYFLCPKVVESHCMLGWLKTQLELSPQQFARVSEIHERLWAEMKRQQSPGGCTEAGAKACKVLTQQLIDEVSAELTPAQKEKYLRLVSPCGAAGRKEPQP